MCFFVPANVLKKSFCVFLLIAQPILAGSWQSTITKDPPGDFSPPPSLEANYHFGWGGFTAATAEARFSKPAPDRFQLDGAGRTVRLARLLWKFDVDYRSTANAATLRPIEANQIESYRSKKLTTHLTFNADGVRRTRTESPATAQTKSREVEFSNLFDLHSALLYLRSQPLADGSVYRILVYPATSTYLATFTVSRREKISVHAGTFPAIKLDLKLQKVNKDLQLEPHKKFRRASVWVSDDHLRIPLRAEAQIFIGSVFVELDSFHVQPEKH